MEGSDEVKKRITEKYLNWYQKNFSNMKKFWLSNFIYPLVIPALSVAFLRYVLNWNLSKEMWVVLYAVLYAVTLIERILRRIEQLIQALDKIIG